MVKLSIPKIAARGGCSTLLLLLGLLAAAPAGAQQGGTLAGTVRTQAGLALPGVEVALDPGGAAARSDSLGRFSLSAPAGVAGTLRFRRAGYLEETLRVTAPAAGERREVAVTLVPLYTLDAVTVTTQRERPLLNTEDASTGGTIERLEAEVLPTDARKPLSLAFSIPGVAPASGFFGDAPPLTISGGNALYTQYTLDGLDNNEGFLGGPRVEFPLAGIARLSVLANAYSAAAGRSSNGVVDVETRAGGSEWTGEAFVFHRPGTPLDAAPKYAPPGVDPDGFERIQVGAAAGGPLVRDRTFAFATVEYSDEREDRIGSTARAAFLGTEVRETWRAFARLDHGWSERQTTTARFALSDVSRAGQGGGVIVPEADLTTRRVGSLSGLTHRTAFRSGESSNTLSAQLGTYHWYFPPTESDFSTPQVTIVAPDRVTVEAVVGSSNFVFDERELQLQLRDVFEARLGEAHTLRMGADVVAARFELDASSTNPSGAYTVVDEGNIAPSGRFLSIRDVPADVRVLRYMVDAQPQEVNLSQTLWSAFLEDRWRVSPSLTLNLGLRWDYDDLTSRGESDPDLDNFQPRASFNWYATPQSVVRGGAGVYTGKLPYAVYSDAVQFGPEGNAVVTLEGEAFPPPAFLRGPPPSSLAPLEEGFPPREIRLLFARGLEQPYSVQGTLGYQRQVGEDWGVSLDAVWVETYDLPRSWDLNAVDRPRTAADSVDRPAGFGDAFRPVEPRTGSYRRLTTTDSGGRGRYLGLYTTARRRLTRGLSVEGSWVWSRARNDTEDINFNATQANDFDAEWADAVNDRRHQLSARAFYTVLERLRLAAIADYQTGTPINRIAGFRDLDGSGPIYGEGFVGNLDRFFGVPRNGERLPDSFLLNASAAYLLPVGVGRLEVRVDAFNLLNSTIVSGFANGIPGGGPRTQVGRPGDPVQYSTAAPARQLQLSGRWVW